MRLDANRANRAQGFRDPCAMQTKLTPICGESSGASWNGGACHRPAGFCALPARLGTALAVVVAEPPTFSAARVADGGAQRTDLGDELASARHGLRRHDADVRAVPQQLDAASAGLDIRLLQTGRSTMLAFHRALDAGIDAGRVTLVHRGPPFDRLACQMDQGGLYLWLVSAIPLHRIA